MLLFYYTQYMSQVIRKYDSGGKTEKPKLFSISGLGDFDQNALIERGYRDVDDYISKKGLKGSMASNFRNAVQYMLEGINNGTLTMDAMGNFQDKTGRASSTGELDRKKFLGIKTGIKDTDNNAYGIAADYLHGLVMNSPKYKQSEKKIEKFNTNDYLAKEISKRWYGGNKIDFNNWFKNRSEQDRNTLIGEIFSSADYNQLYNDYDWTDTGINSAEDLATRGKAFSTAISNNELNNDDYNAFATLGGSGLDKYMKEDSTQTEPTPEQTKMKAWETEAEAAGATTPEAKEAFIQKKQREEADRNAAIIKESKDDVYRRERDAFFNDYAAKNPFRETIQSGYAPSSLSYKPEDYDKPIRDFYNNDIDQYLNDNLSRDWFKAGNGQHIANHMDYIINHLGMALPDAGDGFVAIPSTFDYNNYTTMVYNPTTRQYKEVSMLVNDALRRLANTYYDSTHTPKRKNGGVLYMQFGGTYSAGANYSRYQQKRELEKKTRDEEAAKQRAESSGRTVEEQKIADRKPGSITSGNWTGEDYTRLASIVADIGSMGAAYIPIYGTATSAVLGAGSSLANYGADLSENGFKWGDLGNLAINLGLDTVGLIPGLGTAAKGSKMLKTAIKYIPRTLSLLAAYNYTGPAIESMKKALTPGTDLTVDDWRNIAEGFKLVLQGGKGVKRTVQARNLKKDLATGNKVLTTLGGKEVTLTPAELSEIRSHRKVEDQQAALQLLKKDDNLQLVGDLNKRWFNPSRYLPNSNIRNEYNFGKTVKKKTSQGLIEVPRVYSNSDKYIAAAMQQDVARVPGLDELLIKYNDWKYGVKSQKPKSKPTKSTKQVKSTALVPTGKRNEHTEYNNEVQGYERDWRRKEAERINQNRLKIDDSRDYRAGIVPREGSISKSEGVDAKQVRAVRKLSSLVSEIADEMAKPPIDRSKLPVLYRGPVINIPSIRTLVEGPARVNYKEISEGLERATKQRLAKDIADTRIERSIAQNTETVARRQAEDAKKNVERQIALTVAQERPKRALTGAARRARQNSLNQAFNSRYYEVMDALRNKPNPTKQKNKKKKKTSRDDRATKKEFGGILLREGGLIPKYQGGNVMQRGTRGSWLNNENTYKDATNLGAWDSYYDMNKIIDDINTSRLLAQQNADEFINTLNGLASQNLPWKKQLNARGYKNWNQLYKTTGFNKYFGEDEGRFDYLGPSTWNRRLFLQTLGSRYNSPENALSVGNDKIWYGDGTWKKVEKALSEPDAEEKVEVVTGQKQAETPAINATTGRRIILPDATSKKFSIHPEDALALGRMVGGLVTNNRAAKLYKEGLKPTLLDTFENYVPLQGNFQAKTSGEQQAGSIQSLAAMPRTSDASLQLAGELDATDRAAQARMQGDLADAERFYQTRMLGQQESDAAKARRVEVANKNRAAINAIDAAKKQIDAGRVTANYQQVLAPWLAGVENQFRQNRAMKNQLALETYQNRASSEYDLALAKILEDYKDDPVGRQKALNQLRSEASANLLKERSKLIDSPWLIQFGEKGTKLTYKEKAMLQRAKDFNKRLADDNKQFHKDIMESKREHNKLIMHMSALTAALIKKGMQL